jgi:hypothetical protein
MKLMWCLCCAMPVSHRESGASRFWGLRTRLKGDCAIPVGCTPEPEPEPAPLVDVGLPFFAVDDGDEFPAGDDDKPFPESWPVISAGETNFDTGSLGKVYGAPGRCHCMCLGRRRFGWVYPFGSHRRGFVCKMDGAQLHRVSWLGEGR